MSPGLPRSATVAGLAAGVAVAAVLTAAAGAAPITFDTALPVAQGEAVLRLQAISARASGDRGRELEVRALPLVGVFGVSGRLALLVVVPAVEKRLAPGDGAGRRESSGLGDVAVIGRLTALRLDRPGGTFRLAPFLGVEMPTGDDDRRDARGRLPPPLQPGSGAWDLVLGSVATWQTLDWQVDTAVSFRFDGAANGFVRGDEARFDASYQRRLLPRELGAGLPRYLYGVLESNLLWQDRDQIGGRADPDSGGVTLFLTPGLQLVGKRFVLEIAVQLPLVQSRNGIGLETDYVAVVSGRLNV